MDFIPINKTSNVTIPDSCCISNCYDDDFTFNLLAGNVYTTVGYFNI